MLYVWPPQRSATWACPLATLLRARVAPPLWVAAVVTPPTTTCSASRSRSASCAVASRCCTGGVVLGLQYNCGSCSRTVAHPCSTKASIAITVTDLLACFVFWLFFVKFQSQVGDVVATNREDMITATHFAVRVHGTTRGRWLTCTACPVPCTPPVLVPLTPAMM